MKVPIGFKDRGQEAETETGKETANGLVIAEEADAMVGAVTVERIVEGFEQGDIGSKDRSSIGQAGWEKNIEGGKDGMQIEHIFLRFGNKRTIQ